MSFCAIPASRSAAMTAAISFALASAASFAVFALVVTPPLIVAWSGGTLTLPSPVTTTRASAGDCGCCACAGTIATTTAAAIAAVAERQRRHAGGMGSVAARIDVAMNGLLRFGLMMQHSADPRRSDRRKLSDALLRWGAKHIIRRQSAQKRARP